MFLAAYGVGTTLAGDRVTVSAENHRDSAGVRPVSCTLDRRTVRGVTNSARQRHRHSINLPYRASSGSDDLCEKLSLGYKPQPPETMMFVPVT